AHSAGPNQPTQAGNTASESESEQVTHLDEKLATIVHVASRRPGDAAGHRRYAGNNFEILKVAVISDVDCRAGMDQVCNKEIGVELTLCGQISIGRTNTRRAR